MSAKLICRSRIQTTPKRGKATSILPVMSYDKAPNPKAEGLEECGGAVSVDFRTYIDGGCGCCGSTESEITLTCTRCKTPFVGEYFGYIHSDIIAGLITEALIARQQKEDK